MLLLTEVWMGESWPTSPVQTERSEICTSDRGLAWPISAKMFIIWSNNKVALKTSLEAA